MPTFLAPDLITALQRDMRVAVTADISRRGGARIEGSGTTGGGVKDALAAGAEGGDLVRFAGHFCLPVLGLRCIERKKEKRLRVLCKLFWRDE